MITYSFRIPATGPLKGDQIIKEWKQHAWEIEDLEHTSIQYRTPENTRTLIDSIKGETNPDKDTIMRIYTDSGVQASGPWHRVYAQYQEGPPLGTTTYTNSPRQMFFRAVSDDATQIATWAYTTAQMCVNVIVSQANAGAVVGP